MTYPIDPVISEVNSAPVRERKYWGFRTDNDYQSDLFEELKAGRLRQGWGYDELQDLRILKQIIASGQRLSENQNQAWPHYRMLGIGEDSIHKGDIMLLPKMPNNSMFCLAEVIGEYYFSIYPESEDHGHILPVKLLTSQGIDRYSDQVDARLRSTMGARNRLWNVSGYKDAIDNLLTAVAGGEIFAAISGKGRLQSAWANALGQARSVLHQQITEGLDSKFHAAEWEEPIKIILEKLYPGCNIRPTAGPSEHGADLVLEIPNKLGIGNGFSWLVPIQIANYTGEIGQDKLGQIQQAIQYYGKEGKVIAAVLMTTAEKATVPFEQRRAAIEQEFGIPVKLMVRKELIDIMTEGLSEQMLDVD